MRSLLYAIARLLGDARAIQRGPVAIGKRIVRKALIATAASTISRWIK